MIKMYWPEQKDEVREIAKREQKLIAMQFDYTSDCDGIMAITQQEFDTIKSEKFSSPYSGWISILEDYTKETGRAWEVLTAVNQKFRNLDADEQIIDILNDFPEIKLTVDEITPEFIKYMEKSRHDILFRLPSEEYPTAYFVITSKAFLEQENKSMMYAEAAMMRKKGGN